MEGGAGDLSPYVPRLLPELAEGESVPLHRVIEGTLVFADLSGFTALSERLAIAGGKAGAEEMTVVLNDVFGELLSLAAARGGEMLKYGGDALLLLFRDERHASQAISAAREMQRELRRVGNVRTDVGSARLRMSVGVHSGPIDFLVVGPHRELIVTGEVPSITAAMETAADAGEILMSPASAALVPPYCSGDAKEGGVLVRASPRALAKPGPAPRPSTDLTAYVPAALRATLAAGPVEPDHRPVAIGFAYLTVHDATDVARIDAAFSALMGVFAAYDITPLATDLAGGGVKVIAAAGLPVAQPDAEERMLRAAHDAVRRDLGLPIRFGIQRGHVFAGTVGPAFRMTYTVIGDVVNTAARLMAKAEPGEVLTLGPVLEYSGTEFEVTELPPFTAKGKSEPLVPLRVGDALGRRRRSDEVLPLAGRDDQLAALQAALAQSREGAPGSIEVVGDAGIGKSRLVDEFVGRAGELLTARAEANELDAARPYRVAELLLGELLGLHEVEHLEKLVKAHAPELRPWLPLIGVATGFEIPPTPETERLAPGTVPAKIREVTVALVAASLDTPTMAVVEDLHWADAPSQRLLHALANAAVPHLTVVVTRRPVDTVVAFGDLASVEVGELADDAAGAMLDQLTGATVLPDARRAVLERAGGNPLFLRELATSIAHGNATELPDRVESLIEARIDRLDPHDRSVLRAASVAGPEFSLEEAEASFAAPIAPIVWDRLAGFVTVDDKRVRFRHALIRDSAYAQLPFRTRRALHAQVGAFLESRDDADAHVERMAVHFAEAGDRPKAWRYGAAAGDRARGRFAYTEAAAFFAAARSAGTTDDEDDEFRVLDSEIYCAQIAGNLGRAVEVAQSGRRRRRLRAPNRARLLLYESICLLNLGDDPGAMRATTAGLKLVAHDPESSAVYMRLLAQRSRVAYAREDFSAARRWAIESSVVAEASGDAAGLAHALSAQFDADVHLFTPDREATGLRALGLFRELDQISGATAVLNLLGNDREQLGNLIGAVEAYDEAETLQRQSGLHLHAAVTGHNRASLLVRQGRLDDADVALDGVIAVFEASGYAMGLLFAQCLRAEIDARRGDIDAAATTLAEAAVALREAGGTENAQEVEVILGECLLLNGDFDGARAAAPDPAVIEAPITRLRARTLIALLDAVAGKESIAAAELGEIAAAAEALGLRYETAVAALLRAQLVGDEALDAQVTVVKMGVESIALVDYLANLKSA